MKKKFIRTDYKRHSKLGKNRKKLQKWRKPKGRDNKMREKRFGYPLSPTVGRKSPGKLSGRINGKVPVLIRNVNELNNVDKNSVVIIGSIGARKKIELVKKTIEKGFVIINSSGGNKKK